MITLQYLIWSNEHGKWWAPAECGYTAIIEDAGRYSFEDANRICQNAARGGPFGGIDGIAHEVMVPCPLSAEAVRQKGRNAAAILREVIQSNPEIFKT